MVHTGLNKDLKMTVSVAVVLCCAMSSQIAGAVVVRDFDNGITATIYNPGDILGQMKAGSSGSTLSILTPNGTVELDGEASGWVPFELEYVERALQQMRCASVGVDVNVYILPMAPVGDGGSFARRDAIYLAPGTGPVVESTVAYITTHELGHVLTWAFLDNQPGRWEQYMQVRGLDAVLNGPTVTHADRAREILAEDIRFLFGSVPATESGSIENHFLPLPNRISGLKEMLAGFFQEPDPGPAVASSSVFPNPCNPLTTVAMAVPAGMSADPGTAILRIFDARGALVTTVEGGRLANGRIMIQWPGTTASGAAAVSGHYLYVLQVGPLSAKGSVTLVR